MSDTTNKVILGGPVQIFLPDYSERCPICGAVLTDDDHGFGLAFGGYGEYITCPEEDCPWWIKMCETDREAA